MGRSAADGRCDSLTHVQLWIDQGPHGSRTAASILSITAASRATSSAGPVSGTWLTRCAAHRSTGSPPNRPPNWVSPCGPGMAASRQRGVPAFRPYGNDAAIPHPLMSVRGAVRSPVAGGRKLAAVTAVRPCTLGRRAPNVRRSTNSWGICLSMSGSPRRCGGVILRSPRRAIISIKCPRCGGHFLGDRQRHERVDTGILARVELRFDAVSTPSATRDTGTSPGAAGDPRIRRRRQRRNHLRCGAEAAAAARQVGPRTQTSHSERPDRDDSQ